MKTLNSRTYSEMSRFETFEERFEYLKLDGRVGEATFGFDRHINQSFYRSVEWKTARRDVIVRDEACDMGVPGYEIYKDLIVHHIVPLTRADIEDGNPCIFDPNNLISVTLNTHNAIHFGDASLLTKSFVERTPNDTQLWTSPRR